MSAEPLALLDGYRRVGGDLTTNRQDLVT